MLSLGAAMGISTLFRQNASAQASSGPASSASELHDPMSYVNPELRETLQELLKRFGAMPPFDASSLPGLRKTFAQFAAPLLPAPPLREKMIPGGAGSPDVRVYIVGDSAGASKPCVLHMHGGGYVSGAAVSEGRNLQELALAHDCVVVSVDYRLAPEVRFPGSLENNYTALKWVYANAESLGVDKERIAIKGESAGAGHAAALAIAARDRREVPICFQVLIYPMLDDRTGSTHELPPQFGFYTWSPASNRFGWSSLLGVPAGSVKVPTNSVPARVADLQGLPPAFIGVGSIDLFVFEDMEYARRLMLAGVPTQLSVVPGAFHGFDGIAPETSLSREFSHAWNEALRRAFSTKF